MKTSTGRLLAVLLAALLVVGAADLAAYAANGRPLLLGKGNKATKVTTLKNKKGTALRLVGKAGRAPFEVSDPTKVANLNADLVDGLDGAGLQNKTYTFTFGVSQTQPSVNFSLSALPAGKYLASLSTSIGSAAPSAACAITPDLPGIPGTNVLLISQAPTLDGVAQINATTFVERGADPLRLTCTRGGGADMTIPGSPNFPSRLTFLRVDDNTTAPLVGVPQG